MKRIQGVVFDLDGTLAETHPMAVAHIGEAIVRHGGPELTPEAVMGLFGPNEKGIFRSVLGARWEEAWEWYWDSYVEKHTVCPAPFDGISSLLESLDAAGCRLAVITGKTEQSGSKSLEIIGLDSFFPAVFGGSIDGVVKSVQLSDLLRTWALSPEEVVYVGDSVADVEEARAAGVRPVSAAWSAYSDPTAQLAVAPEAQFSDVGSFAIWLNQNMS